MAALVAAGWLIWPFWQLATQLEAVRSEQPSRLYARAMDLELGARVRSGELLDELARLGYRKVESQPERTGEFRWSGRELEVFLRRRPTADGWLAPARLSVRFARDRVQAISWAGQEVLRAELEPVILTTFLGEDRRDKRPVALERVPQSLIHAVLAAEDAGFFQHAGLSVRGIARAFWINLRGRELQQGGSTLTQQLVKNLFLTHERTLARKLREVLLAVLVDLRYAKEAILSAYLNEIYWGSDGSVNVIGVGAAAWAYFGKDVAELDLCESALLAAVIRSPGRYSPEAAPERALARRNWVLDRMAELEWLPAEAAESGKAEPLCFEPRSTPLRAAPYFADWVRSEARERFGVGEIEDAGLALLSTLDHRMQAAAEAAVDWGVEALESGWEKGRGRTGELQAALVSIDPRTGAVRAYLGGRDYGSSQFDRAATAHRQAGSAFKPIVYAAALEAGTVSPASFVEDAPITVALAGRRWSPSNSDGDFRGWVSVREAFERSLNIPTVRVALDVGLPEVIATARALGVRTPMERVPALALGAFEVTPLDLATVYATFGAAGVRPPVHGLRGVLNESGGAIEGQALPEPERVLSQEISFVLTTMMQGVLDRGTARSVRKLGIEDRLAGKTGTTNDRRDSWFGGFSPELATLVWVGYDDNAPTRLSGARAALPIWARYVAKVRPAAGYGLPRQPAGVVTAVVDPATGDLATDACPKILTEYFVPEDVPSQLCRLHGDWPEWAVAVDSGSVDSERRRPWRWLSKVFGRGRAGRRP